MTWESVSRISLMLQQLLLVYCISIANEPALFLCFASLLAHLRSGILASYVRLLLSSYLAFFLAGLAIYQSLGYIYDSSLIKLTSASVFFASPFTLLGSRTKKSSLERSVSLAPGLHIFVGVLGLAVIVLFFPFGLSGVQRIEAQAGNGLLNLTAQALGVLALLSSSQRPLATKIIMLMLSCALFATFSMSRSSAILAISMYLFINHPIFIPKKIVIISGGFFASIFILLASIRSIGDTLASSLRHAISDPLATHAYFYAYQRSDLLLGEYVFSYFHRLIPRALWEDKPDVIGFGRAVALNDNTRTPGMVVEGFANFGLIGAIVFPLIAGAVFVWSFRNFFHTRNVYLKIYFSFICFDFFAFGRAIVTKIPYVLAESLIATVIAAIFLHAWGAISPATSARPRKLASQKGTRYV